MSEDEFELAMGLFEKVADDNFPGLQDVSVLSAFRFIFLIHNAILPLVGE